MRAIDTDDTVPFGLLASVAKTKRGWWRLIMYSVESHYCEQVAASIALRQLDTFYFAVITEISN